LEDVTFSPDCEVETRMADDSDRVEVHLIYTLVGLSMFRGQDD